MKIKILILFVLIAGFIQVSSVFGEKVSDMPEIMKPERFVFGNGYIYILENTTIHIYEQKTYKYIGKFGKEGEGPREIKKNVFGGPIGVIPFRGNVVITSSAKVSFYTKTGEYIKEHKVSQFDNFYPYGDSYVLMSQAPMDENKDKLVLALFMADKDFQKGRLLYKSDFQIGRNFVFEFPVTPFYPIPTDDQLFIIAGKDGFAINKYDLKGNKTGRIYKKVKKMKISSDFKKKTIEWFKKSPNYKNAWNFFKDRIAFKDHYPQIYTAFSGKNRLYVFTSLRNGDSRECIVMDFNGKEIKRLNLYAPELYGMDFNFIANVNSNYYYWIHENDDEEWELHREKIE